MARTGASNLPGAMTPPEGYWNNHMTPAKLLGLQQGSSGTPGAALPPSSAMSGDRAHVWYSPDSPEFWLIVLAGTTLLGISGLSFKLRAGPAKAGAAVGST